MAQRTISTFSIDIDTEWRSDLKWNRIAGAVDFSRKTVLDVGCGNGYYGWRMLHSGTDLQWSAAIRFRCTGCNSKCSVDMHRDQNVISWYRSPMMTYSPPPVFLR